MPRRTVLKMRCLAALLLGAYAAFTASVLYAMSGVGPLAWCTGIVLGAYVADLLSGGVHMFIDFAVSDRKTLLHKELFLSRVHHHELFRPARLNYASLWFSPALYAFLALVLAPALVLVALPGPAQVGWSGPFWLALVWFSSVAQVAHAFAHGKARHPLMKAFVRRLQGCRLLVPPRVHLKHHREIDCHFSVLNGWSIPLLDVVFKRWIEHRLSFRTNPARQLADMRLKLSWPYEEIL